MLVGLRAIIKEEEEKITNQVLNTRDTVDATLKNIEYNNTIVHISFT
jgi:hypothetical protein